MADDIDFHPIKNTSERLYNLKGMSENGHNVTVRVPPGLSLVNVEHMRVVQQQPYVQKLIKKGILVEGEHVEDEVDEALMEDEDSVREAQSKSVKNPKENKTPSKSKKKS